MIDIATSGFWMHDELAAAMPDARFHRFWSSEAIAAAPDVARRVRGLFTYPTSYPIDQALLDQMPALEIIVVMGAGVEIVDAEAAMARGVAVHNCHGANARDVAELAMGLMLAAGRGIATADADLRRGNWINKTTRRVTGQRLGIFGMGSIGQAIARLASAFDMPISYHSRRERPDLDFTYVPTLRELAERVDILVLAAPASPETDQVVDRVVIEALGPEGLLVNIARGSLVDEEALIAALGDGRLGGAAIDVYASEPNFAPALRDLPNLLLSPHNGANTFQSFATVRAMASSIMSAHFAGSAPARQGSDHP